MISILRGDNDSVFKGIDFRRVCTARTIRLTFGNTYTPKHIGYMERYWRIASTITRCLRQEAGLPDAFWALASQHATNIYNMVWLQS